mgnify:CR=1 FL=1|tara:strand:+ start:48818 stop:49318 length:501 start_codon:yes stop_codon:yes gene_type:complete
MKHTKLFKKLIDFLFYILCLDFLVVLFFGPLGFNTIAQENREVQHWDTISWLLLFISATAYVFLIIGVKYLKNMAKEMTNQGSFGLSIQYNLRQSGKYVIISTLLNYLTFALIFIKQLFLDSKLEIIFDNNILLQIILTITGLFFIIQSDILKLSNNLKTENDLTI